MDRIEKKLNSIDKKIDIIMEQTWRQDERLKQATKEIENLKEYEIKEKVKAEMNRFKVWVYSGIVGLLTTFILTAINFFR